MPEPSAESDESPPSTGSEQRSFGKRLLSGATWIAVGRIASVGTFFLAHAVLARAMDKGQFAAYGIVTSLAPALITFVGFGCPQILTRDVRRLIYSDGPHRVVAAVRSCTQLFLISCVALAIACFAIAPLLGDSESWSGLKDYTGWIVAFACASGGGVLAAYALQGLDEFRTAVMIGSRKGGLIPNAAFLAAITLLWLATSEVGLQTAVALQTGLTAAVLPIAWIAIRRRIGEAAHTASLTSPTGDYSLPYYFRESWPCLLSQLTVLAVEELDVIWVAAFSSDAAVADYKGAKLLIRLVAAPYLMFVMAMGPFTAELIEKQQLRRLERMLRGSTTFVGLPMLAVCLAFVLFPATIVRWAFGAGFESAAPLLQIVAVGQAIRVLMGATGQVLIMAGMQRLNMTITVIALAGYVMAAPAAIKHFGPVGAAYAFAIWIVAQGLAGTLLVKKRLGLWTFAELSPRAVAEYVRIARETRNR